MKTIQLKAVEFFGRSRRHLTAAVRNLEILPTPKLSIKAIMLFASVFALLTTTGCSSPGGKDRGGWDGGRGEVGATPGFAVQYPQTNAAPLVPNPTPMSESDVSITTEIQQKILIAAGITDDAREIQVVTQNARVTLSGTVATQYDKNTLGQIAAEVVQPENVDNQLVLSEGPFSAIGGN
jgi:hypothetical protein